MYRHKVGLFYVLYSTLLHLPPLRFHCAGGCWDAGLLQLLTLAVRHPNHSARSHTEEVRERMAVFFYHYKKNVVGRKMLLY
jgi:hypothetical protein